MRFLFLNQYFPPDPAPTGVLLQEIADYLAARGHVVQCLSSRQNYRSAKKGGRAVRELRALLTILWHGLRAPRPDVVLSATSPPLLLFVATLVARRHRATSAHWLFDMYPELALNLGEIPRGFLARAIEALMRWSYQQTKTMVALDQDMLEVLKKYGVSGATIAPWVFAALAEKPAENHQPPGNFTWLYSGNLGRAHEWQPLLETQALLEKRGSPWRLIFQGGGPSWPLAQAAAQKLGLKNIEWKTYVPESELRGSLLAAEVLIVTQRPETKGLLWPSKLALVRTLPRRILWVGPVDGAIAAELQPLPQAGIFSAEQTEAIGDWLEHGPVQAPIFSDAEQVRAAGLECWGQLLEGQI